MAYLVRRFGRLGMVRLQILNCNYSTMVQGQLPNRSTTRAICTLEDQCNNQAAFKYLEPGAGVVRKHQIGENVSRKDKMNFLVNTLFDLKDSKEAVYGALDAWVAWEQNFPIASLKRVLAMLEKEQQWHKVIQVIKWMLSKGQGMTMGTYGQLIRALDMDERAEEAHKFWMKKIGLEDFDRKPPEKSVVQKVADAYEMLGRHEDKKQVLEKYSDLFADTWKGKPKKYRTDSSNKKKKSGKRTSDALTSAVDDVQRSGE